MVSRFPLRKQLLLGFLSVAAASLLLALAVVMGTTAFIGDKAESEARASLEEQIKRHITDASAEAAATIGERFRKLQYGVLDVTAFALRDAIQEDFDLDGGGEGYPLTPAHADLRDIEITARSDNLDEFYRQDIDVDLSRSVWYYSNSTSFTADVPEIEKTKIAQTARLDLMWPTMYNNSDDTKAILIGAELPNSSEMFRYFPGNELSAVPKSRFKCEFVEEDGSTSCYDPTARDWYIQAVDAPIDPDTGFGEAIITEPYIDAIGSGGDWLVTLARAVRSDAGEVLGVVAVDVRLEEVQLSIEELSFLDNGYSVFATAGEGTVLASGRYDREGENETTTVCALREGICSEGDGDGWEDLLSDTGDGGVKTFTYINGTAEEGEYILVAAPVNATFESTYAGGVGTLTHYILSAVPRKEIFKPVSGMADLIQDSTTQILVTTAIVACCTLAAVAAAVYFLAGSITRPIVKMTSAARSIAKDGAKTDVFGSVSAAWGGGRESGSVTGGGSSSMDSRTAGRYSINRTRTLDYLLCRGDDEISTLAREFSLMITGLGKRGSAAEAKGLAESSIYPKNPFTTEYVRPPPTAPSAPTATATATATAAAPAATNH